MKLSTLRALLEGDLENAMISATPGGIKAQEARGQQDFVASTTLPRDCMYCTREQLEKIGIVFGEIVDNLFIKVQLPEGWKKQPTSHSMWSDLLDDKDRRRVQVFYKAAFYDRRAHISLSCRFSYHVDPVCGYDDPSYNQAEWYCIVMDCGETIWTSHTMRPQLDCSGDKLMEWYEEKDALAKLGKEWLEENYPDWQNPLAYWEED